MSVEVTERPIVGLRDAVDYQQVADMPGVSVLTRRHLMAEIDPKAWPICTAKAKTTGNRCQRPAIRGGFVCRFHGGKAPQVIQKAKDRLAALVDPAITELTRLMSESDLDAVRLAVAKDILDRTGHKPTDKIEITDTTRRLDALQQGRERARLAKGDSAE